ncbi:MAG: thioredoxin family protein [Bacteroidetes bacterium]|nr:thioredoxin family protein [Bacteroidota bacterium]
MMGKPFFSIAFAASVLISLALTVNKNNTIEIGQTAPLLSEKMKGVDGNEFSLLDLKKEKGLVVVFSCNTCPFVIGSDSFGGWERMYNETAEIAAQKGFGFVLINSNEAKREGDDSFEEMKKRASLKNYNMPYLVDSNSKLANAFGAKTTPHVYVLNKDMELVYMGSIDNSWDNSRKEDIPYLQNALKQLDKGTKVIEASTPPRGCSIKRK